jgi:hypothetical protein
VFLNDIRPSVSVWSELRADGSSHNEIVVNWYSPVTSDIVGDAHVRASLRDALLIAAVHALMRDEDGTHQAAWDLAQDRVPWLPALVELARKAEGK